MRRHYPLTAELALFEPHPGAQPSSLPPASGERDVDLASAVAAHRAEGDLASAAHAQLALGQALLAAGEPAGREVLEDAGTWFEELGDEASMQVVDLALRDAAESIEESPRSFHRRASDSQIPAAVAAQNIKPPCT
jgi:hypothetical protein